MKNNKKLLIFVAILILISLVYIIYSIMNQIRENAKHHTQEEYGYSMMPANGDSEVQKKLDAETAKQLKYENVTLLQDLEGELPVSKVTAAIRKAFMEEMPKLLEKTKNMTATELAKYYTENETTLKRNFLIADQEGFEDMLEEFKSLTSNLETDYKVCKFEKDDSTIKFVFNYKNGETVDVDIIGNNVESIVFDF